MSDRTNTITVVLEHELRADDADTILNAIRMIKGVLTAKANVANPGEYMAIERARAALGTKIINVIYPKIAG